MIIVMLINKDNVRFDKTFPNEYLADKFIKKLRYSKTLTYVGQYKE